MRITLNILREMLHSFIKIDKNNSLLMDNNEFYERLNLMENDVTLLCCNNVTS